MKNKFLTFTFILPLIMAGCGGNSNKPEEYISDGSVTGVSLNASSISLSVVKANRARAVHGHVPCLSLSSVRQAVSEQADEGV